MARMTDIDAIRRTYQGMEPERLIDALLHLHVTMDHDEAKMRRLASDYAHVTLVRDNLQSALDASNGQLHILDAWLRRNIRMEHDGVPAVDRALYVLETAQRAKVMVERIGADLWEQWGEFARMVVGGVVHPPARPPLVSVSGGRESTEGIRSTPDTTPLEEAS